MSSISLPDYKLIKSGTVLKKWTTVSGRGHSKNILFFFIIKGFIFVFKNKNANCFLLVFLRQRFAKMIKFLSKTRQNDRGLQFVRD